MQREILFRGKRVSDNAWIEGFYDVDSSNGKEYIHVQHYAPPTWSDPGGECFSEYFEVAPLTVSQYTGLKTEKYKRNLDPRVFEGDLFREERENFQGKEYIQILVVMWIKQLAAFYLIPEEHYQIMLNNDVSNEPEFAWLFDAAMLHDFSLDSGLTKVGNIHDHHTTSKESL